MNQEIDKPLVSVIVPVFNAAKYLDEAIGSILSQTYPNVEVIAVNDGSTDVSLNILEKYSSRITIIDSTNKGTPAARNLGIQAAKGSYLAFLDADDIWHHEKLSVQLNMFDKTPNLDMTYCSFEEFLSPDLSAEQQARRVVKPGVLSVAVPGTTLILRASFDSVGSFSETRRSGEFIDWYARAEEIGLKIVPTNHCHYRRRSHADNQTLRLESLHQDYMEVVREALRRRREFKNNTE
jgi:glycosyltransferase involved in cell wall biosynthesis